MALFDQTLEISVEDVASIVLMHWNVKLGKIIKASQNHTFEAAFTDGDSEVKRAVRVTPDPSSKHLARVTNEVAFVDYIAKTGELSHVCAPIRSLQGELLVRERGLIIVVSEWAIGAPLDFLAYRWMTDENVVFAWGKWLAQFHVLSRRFSAEFPDIAQSIQRWDEMHHGILKGSEIHADDQAVVHDIAHYGVLHGDLNVSNFFFAEATPTTPATLSAFDWDQTQQGWYLWDVAQTLLTIHMLAGAGSVVDGSPVPLANPAQFESWVVRGYESISGAGSVDLDRLHRMVELRKHFYKTFCRRAKEQGDIPKDMEHFIHYIVAWFDREDKEAAVTK